MYDWIYKYFINTYWFLMFGLSLPFLFGIYLIYQAWKENQEDNQQNQEQGQENKQEEQQQGQ
jgi:cadmium resistance protein CadD (predicted permease)